VPLVIYNVSLRVIKIFHDRQGTIATSAMIKSLIAYSAIGVITFIIGYTGQNLYFSVKTPRQPIEFSHRIHAGDNGIPCLYCHIYAERSRVSGVPSVRKCMGCHSVIKTDSPEIQKLASYWDKEEPMQWVKVHNLPDHVYFPHKRHVAAGVKCQASARHAAGNENAVPVPSDRMTGWPRTARPASLDSARDALSQVEGRGSGAGHPTE